MTYETNELKGEVDEVARASRAEAGIKRYGRHFLEGKQPKPTLWRDVSSALRAHYLYLALYALSPRFDQQRVDLYLKGLSMRGAGGRTYSVYAFDLNLSHAVAVTSGTRAGKTTDYIRRRLAKQFADFGATPYWFVVELAKDGRLHLHGFIGLLGKELKGARERLKRAGGFGLAGAQDSAFAKRHALQVTPIDDIKAGFGKVRYDIKDLASTEERIQCDPIATSHLVSEKAKEIFENHRKLLLRELAARA